MYRLKLRRLTKESWKPQGSTQTKNQPNTDGFAPGPSRLGQKRSEFRRPRSVLIAFCLITFFLLSLRSFFFCWNRQHISRSGHVSADWRQLSAACFLAWSWFASNMCLAHCPARRPSTTLLRGSHAFPKPPTQACRSTASSVHARAAGSNIHFVRQSPVQFSHKFFLQTIKPK